MSQTRTPTSPTQREIRHGVDVGPQMGQVSPVVYWYRTGHFKSDEEARGAFELAYQQAMDGMGTSVSAWMGLTSEEYDAWRRDGTLPPR